VARLEPTAPIRCDVFCRVIDNFGDAAVAWRIARSLAREHGFIVHLKLDRLDVLGHLLQRQVSAGDQIDRVVIREFKDLDSDHAPLLIETFGCGLPDGYLADRAESAADPVLINVEYLSAEGWIEGVHQLSSPARDGMPQRHFFFPGFGEHTGGMLRETGIAAQRHQMLDDPLCQLEFLRGIGVPLFEPDAVRLSWFGYEGGWPDNVFLQLAGVARSPIHVILAEGVMSRPVQTFCGAARAGTTRQISNLRLTVVPFLAQDDYDRLLLCCQVNLVRGEDSLIRAQLAGRPMLWDIYPQDDRAHQVKLEAFLNRYCAGWAAIARDSQFAAAFALVSRSEDFWRLLSHYCERVALYDGYARRWAEQLDDLPELGTELANFAQKLLK
jgi:uncharacterized repeat protein (TIGR03837 family)